MNPAARRGVTAATISGVPPIILCLIALLAAMFFFAPQVFAAKGGIPGKPGVQPDATKVKGPFSTVSGTVTNNYGVPISGASITFAALTASYTTATDGTGQYTIKVPAATTFDITFEADHHETYSITGSLIKGKNNTLDAVLQADAAVIVNASVSNTAQPDSVLNATGSYLILDGSSYMSSGWEWAGEGVEPAISDGSDTPTVTLGSVTEYADHLIQVLRDPPITEDDLPPDVVLQPINQVMKGLQDRNQVVAINPHALEAAEAVPLSYSVTTTSGTYTAEVDVLTHLPWGVSTGVRTVPIDSTVLLYAKEGASYSWNIVTAPGGSTASLTDATTQTPWFTPDMSGTYQVEETVSGAIIDVHAGLYHGVIDPVLTLESVMLGDGRPVADENCTGCHTENGAAPPNFDTWRNTGHAEAFTQGITTNSHFGESCFACHAVGFGKETGIDDTPNYDMFLADLSDAQHANPPTISGLWESMLMNEPDTARLSNIQCENCHGPQSYTEAHMHQPGEPRVSLAADVCGSCHGEPARHGRFQQWQLSNHADYDLARSRGDRANCGRCHSGNGFVLWSKFDFDPEETLDGLVDWDDDTVVPQTCPACHNPHDTGTTSGSDETNAKVRVMGDTHLLLAGFMATNVGKGATCMTCHNSRAEYPRNDSTWAQVVANGDTTDRPHHGVQADLIMGQNMYFFENQDRGKHSFIEDTCVTCHMNKTQPPDILSYNQAGTNHTFAADPNICSDCHGGSDPNAENIDAIMTGYMNDLQDELGAAYQRMMEANYPVDVGSTCGPADGSTVTVSDVVWAERATRLDITLSNGNSCTRVDPEDITIDSGAQTLYDLSLASNDGAVLKAAWNWNMNNEDETIIGCEDAEDPDCDPPHTHRGVHNPDFQISSLTRAIAAVQAVSP